MAILNILTQPLLQRLIAYRGEDLQMLFIQFLGLMGLINGLQWLKTKIPFLYTARFTTVNFIYSVLKHVIILYRLAGCNGSVFPCHIYLYVFLFSSLTCNWFYGNCHSVAVKRMDQLMHLIMGITELVPVLLCKLAFHQDDMDSFMRDQVINC